MPILIREAVVDDVAELADLLVEVNDLHAEALSRVYQRAADDQTAGFLRRLLEEEGIRLFVAEAEGRVVGYLALQVARAPDTPVHVPRRWVAVDTVVVRQSFRRTGIGEALMEHAHAWAAARGIDQVELTVAEFNAAAIALYEKLGYATAYRRMGRSLADRMPDEGASG